MNEDENGSLLVRNSREEKKNRERSTASNKYIHPPDEVAFK